MPTSFSQTCPTCGRTLHIHADHENQRVACRHCRGAFVARQPSKASIARCDWRTAMMRRADDLLLRVAKQSELASAS